MAGLLILLLNLFTILLLISALLSWFPIGYDSPVRPVADTLRRITDPVLAPVRRVLPPLGGLDLSVMVVVLVIQAVLIPLVASLG